MYSIEFTPSAAELFRSLPKFTHRQAADSIDELESNPRKAGTKQLRAARGLRRLVIGDYRVIYGIEESSKTVCIEHVGHREDVYKFLDELAKSLTDDYDD